MCTCSVNSFERRKILINGLAFLLVSGMKQFSIQDRVSLPSDICNSFAFSFVARLCCVFARYFLLDAILRCLCFLTSYARWFLLGSCLPCACRCPAWVGLAVGSLGRVGGIGVDQRADGSIPGFVLVCSFAAPFLGYVPSLNCARWSLLLLASYDGSFLGLIFLALR